MRLFLLFGKPEKVSKEQLRSFLHASFSVLAYHNWVPQLLPLSVRLRKNLKNLGEWRNFSQEIYLRSSLDPETMLTTVLHEMIHACHCFPDETVEKCTSTLTAKLKPDVARIAHLLLDGTYQRAAYLAHTKLSYRAVAQDFYDTAEDVPLGIKTKYHR